MGAAVGFGISYFFMFAYYMILIRKSIKIKFSAKPLITSAIILAGGGFIFYNTENVWWRIIYWAASILTIYLILPKSIVYETINRIAGKFSNFRK
jgi:O-antigen/teichoic acid export membrane protein